MGRETFWSPPHLLLYASVLVAIGTGLWSYRRTRERSLMWLAFVLFLIPISAPVDELWHRVFGVEPVNSPLIIWSPPHVLLALSIASSFLLLFRYLHEDDDPIARHLLQSIALACAFGLLNFLASPLEPIGPHHLMGFAGAAVGGGIIVAMLLLAQKWMGRFGSASSVATVFLLVSAINFGEKLSPNVNIQPHEHSPGWLIMFSILVPAVTADLLRDLPTSLRGLLIGILHAGILYGFSSQFFAPLFQYGTSEMWIAIAASAVSALAVGIVIHVVPFSRSRTRI